MKPLSIDLMLRIREHGRRMMIVPLHRIQKTVLAVMAALFGLVCILPAVFMRLDPASGFRGIEMNGTDAEIHYAARVQEVRDGFVTTANTFYPDPKNQPYLQPSFPETLIAAMGSFFGLDAPRALILSEFLFGALVFGVLVGCFCVITNRFWWPLIGVSAYLFAGAFFSGPLYALGILFHPSGGLEFLQFSRPINPQISATLFFGALWGFIHWIRTRSRKGLAAACVLTGIAFYTYVYAWSLLGAFYAIITLSYALRKDKSRLKELAWFAGGLILFFIPYAWNLSHAIAHPLYEETSKRLGMVASRAPVLGKYVLVLFVLPVLFRKRLGSSAWIVLGFAIASVIALNQQLVTGRVIVPSHYHWYFIKPMAAILAVILIGSFVLDRVPAFCFRRMIIGTATAVLLVFFIIFGAVFQYRSYVFAQPFWTEQQHTAGVLSFLRTATGPGDMVYADRDVRDLIPIYTSADVLTATHAMEYLSSDERARSAYFFDLWLQGVSAEEAAATFPNELRADLSGHIHGIYYREANGGYANISDAEIAEEVRLYAAYISQSPETILDHAFMDFAVISRSISSAPALEALRSASFEAYADDLFEVRSFGKEQSASFSDFSVNKGNHLTTPPI